MYNAHPLLSQAQFGKKKCALYSKIYGEQCKRVTPLFQTASSAFLLEEMIVDFGIVRVQQYGQKTFLLVFRIYM